MNSETRTDAGVCKTDEVGTVISFIDRAGGMLLVGVQRQWNELNSTVLSQAMTPDEARHYAARLVEEAALAEAEVPCVPRLVSSTPAVVSPWSA
ncbi:hypothetical protein [Methylobacterium soli]|uniref:Uncharacterized protein n=1 Tax=Methylobacterium soli TaxID=553447 RepID=A0A6L3SSY1_9HYPH|nr:hypothetical protein [Methylobacterium soli]KAB1076679.1 hypothetical protein F6X53_22575 [Methylobacterium soli]GJE45460.1 hypothetical protein AEGHOMDF_4655 [Methylobacterium soli]